MKFSYENMKKNVFFVEFLLNFKIFSKNFKKIKVSEKIEIQ
jgi:hypothetical protein